MLRETDGKAQCNLFRALGFGYYFVRKGNDFNAIADALQKVKNTDHPVVIHMCTAKGKGYLPAELDRENWHYMGPFNISTEKPLYEAAPIETYENLTRDYLAVKMKNDPTIVAVTAGTPKVLGFDKNLRKQFPQQFVDVGIAEEHAMAMVSGIAKTASSP